MKLQPYHLMAVQWHAWNEFGESRSSPSLQASSSQKLLSQLVLKDPVLTVIAETPRTELFIPGIGPFVTHGKHAVRIQAGGLLLMPCLFGGWNQASFTSTKFTPCFLSWENKIPWMWGFSNTKQSASVLRLIKEPFLKPPRTNLFQPLLVDIGKSL